MTNAIRRFKLGVIHRTQSIDDNDPCSYAVVRIGEAETAVKVDGARPDSLERIGEAKHVI